MVNRLRRYVASTVCTLAVSVTLLSGVAHAATNTAAGTGGNGMRVSPLRQDLTIAPGKSRVIDIYVENVTSSPETLRGTANDFVASSDESGIPRVLFDEKADAPSHGLHRYIKPIDAFTLAPKERKDIKVTIAIPSNAAGGGYYGAIRFVPANTDSSKNVSLSASVGTLLLVTVPGDIKEQMGVTSLNVSRDAANAKASTLFTSGKNLQASVRFKNTGNVQEEPFGKLTLKKSGKEVASYEVNSTEPRGAVLPDSIRRFDIKLADKAQSLGKYSVEGYFGYGKSGKLISASTTFYVVPLLYVLVAAGVIALIVLAIFIIPRMLKEHDRRLIRRLRGGKS